MIQNQKRDTTTLNGTWSFALDPENNQQWDKIMDQLPEKSITIPGSWEEQGYGEPSDHDPIGTWKKAREYEGIAWYIKDIDIPSAYEGRQILLHLKGVRWISKLWIDGKFVGQEDSLVTPHSYDITEFVEAGQSHRFTIQLDNQMRYSLHESHIHSYHTATNWGGITGGIELESMLPYSFENIKLQPRAEEKSVDVKVTINNGQASQQRSLLIHVFEQDGTKAYSKKLALEAIEEYQFTIELGKDAKLWSPEQPHLYQLELSLIDNEDNQVYDQKALTFGLRTMQTDTRQILLNGDPIFLTGYVDCCIFPQTGYPVWDKEAYKKQFKIVKEYGFNHVRLHGWTPPKPFFEAADEEGILVQTELPHWGRGYIEREKKAPEEVHQFLKRELERIITLLHTHPSFVMLSLGNELSSKEGHPQLNELVQYARELDATRLYTDNTGFGELPEHDREGDFFIPTLNWHPPYHKDDAAHPDTTQDFREITRLTEKPMIAHEHGQFTTYVRPREAEKYQGVLQPNWLKTINETLKEKGFEQRLDEFIEATSVHMKRTLKEAMEKARRTPGLSGIQLLDIRDFAGQGHATVGVLNVFWEDKGIISPEEFRQYNDQTVLLMRSPQRTYFTEEKLAVDIEVSHFGKSLNNVTLVWQLSDGDGVIHQEEQNIEQLPGNGLSKIAHLQVQIPKGRSRKLELTVELTTSGTSYFNQWDFWVFERPKLITASNRIWTNISSLRSMIYGARFEEVIGIDHLSYKKEANVDLAITNRFSRDILQYIVDGGSVWLVAEEGKQFDEIHTRYLPIFWNYLWFPGQSGTTMGMIIHEHPVLNKFPHDRYSNWHWFHLVNERVALNLEQVPNVKPIIEVIDNFNRAKRLAYAFEFRLGKGRVFVSSLNVANVKIMKLPEVQQMLFDTINYLTSDEFAPKASLTMGDVLGMFKVYDPFFTM